MMVLAIALWVLTFWPAWKLLGRLTRQTLQDESPWRSGSFWLNFVVYRLVIALPYLVLITSADLGVSWIRSVLIGWVLLGVFLSMVRFIGRERLASAVWSGYARVYDGLRHFVPYQDLVASVVDRIPSSARRITDVGCGTANVLQIVRADRSDVKLVGVDTSQAMLARAQKKLAGGSVLFVHQDALSYLRAAPANSVDCLVSTNQMYTLEKEEREEYLELAQRMLDTNGLIIIATAAESGLWPIMQDHLQQKRWFTLLRPSLVAVFFFNVLIELLERSSEFEFVDAVSLAGEIEAAGLEIVATEPNYGGTGVLFLMRCGEVSETPSAETGRIEVLDR